VGVVALFGVEKNGEQNSQRTTRSWHLCWQYSTMQPPLFLGPAHPPALLQLLQLPLAQIPGFEVGHLDDNLQRNPILSAAQSASLALVLL
jgi:hypothetical protein